MKTIFQASTVLIVLGCGAAGALAQTTPGNPPAGGDGQPKGAAVTRMAPVNPPSPTAPTRPGAQQDKSSPNSALTRPHTPPPADADTGSKREAGSEHELMPQPQGRPGFADRGRTSREIRPDGIRQRSARFGENPATWSPRYRRPFVRGYGSDRELRYGYASRSYGYGPRRYTHRYPEYARHRAYDVAVDVRAPVAYVPRYRARFAYTYRYRPRVRYAYAETPYAYDLPRETYATGIFPTTSALGLHSYEYAYTTRVRPIAAYGGPTGSYAGGYPIYNRPLAPAYPTPGCACD